MKFLVEVGFELTETRISIQDDTPVMGAYETTILHKKKFGPYASRPEAARRRKKIKQGYLAQGYSESFSRPHCLLHPVLRISEEIHLTIKEVEVSRTKV